MLGDGTTAASRGTCNKVTWKVQQGCNYLTKTRAAALSVRNECSNLLALSAREPPSCAFLEVPAYGEATLQEKCMQVEGLQHACVSG